MKTLDGLIEAAEAGTVTWTDIRECVRSLSVDPSSLCTEIAATIARGCLAGAMPFGNANAAVYGLMSATWASDDPSAAVSKPTEAIFKAFEAAFTWGYSEAAVDLQTRPRLIAILNALGEAPGASLAE